MPWADEAEQQLSRVALSGSEVSGDVRIFRAWMGKEPRKHLPLSESKWDVCGGKTRKHPNLCASVRALPWADEAEQQLSRLAPSGCQLSADVRTFEAGLRKESGWDTTIPSMRLKFQVAREASSPNSLCLYVNSAMGR